MSYPHPASPTGSESRTPSPPPPTLEQLEAWAYLGSLLNKNLRLHTTDGRMFRGEFKCTDPNRNVVLAHTYEYRQPSQQKLAAAAAAAAAAQQSQQEGGESSASASASGAPSNTVNLEMSSRYLGLVVVPGEHIVKMEVEEFASQVGRR